MNTLFGIESEQLIIDCLRRPFPGTIKWVAEHPIWDCYVDGHISPKSAWGDYSYIEKAVNNLFWIVKKSISEKKYDSFVKRIKNACTQYDIRLYREVLNRFTVAKIAPKVTALQPKVMLKIIEDSGIKLDSGVYCPMAGFGGIVEGSKKWLDKNKIKADIEAYDINEKFCKWYGWEKRDVLEQYITTDKIVIACPPFGEHTEKWEGTPDNMYYDFHTWCKLIQEHIKAPNYILIGPEINSTKNKCGLFTKTTGIKWYSEYSK